MEKNSYPGKFIVFEGIDGSGKSTQLKLLAERLRNLGFDVAAIDFPQYGQKSAGMVEEYLTGKYGKSLDVGPYRASIFYACDRYDASFKIRKWIKEGKIVVCDRYFASNAGHQGGKIKNKEERLKFIKWLYDLEFNIFEIPKPDINFILKVPPQVARDMVAKITDPQKKEKKKIYLQNKKRDIHEKDISHLINAEISYMRLADQFPGDFKVIDCTKNGILSSPQVIHDQVFSEIKDLLHSELNL